MILKKFDDIHFINSYVDRKKLLFAHGEQIREMQELSQKDIERVSKFLEENTINIKNGERYEKLKSRLKASHKFVCLSVGEQTIIYILSALSKLEPNSIFIADSLFTMCDKESIKMIIDLMNLIHLEKKVQFILIMANCFNDIFEGKNYNITNIKRTNEQLNPVAYNYTDKLVAEANNEKEETIEIIRYCKGQILPEEECRNVEFKEIKGNNPCSSIIDTTPIYIVAYLNSNQSEEGFIKWGIDNNGKVMGVVLNSEEKDKIRRRLSEEIRKADPYISSDLYNIWFQPVVSEEKEILTDTYVIEIVVKQHNELYLFSTAKGEVYIKSEGGKLKLSPLEIQKEILIRANRFKNII